MNMFRIKLYGVDTLVEVEHNKQVLDFQIDAIINKRLTEKLNPDTTFKTLNAFIDYKGEDFKKELHDRLTEAKNENLRQLTVKELSVLPLKMIHNILDMFDLQEVHDFIIKSKIIKAPKMLADEFDKNIIINDEGSREQTYLKSDYYWLIALITILRSTLGPIGEFATIKGKNIPASYKEYILLNFYKTHPIFNTPPFQKLVAYVKKLVDISFLNEEDSAIRIIELKIAKEELVDYVLAQAIIQRLILLSEHDDNEDRNLVTKLYHFVKNRIKLKDSPSNSNIRIKRHIINEDGGDTESKLETFRVGTDIPPGILEEFRFVYNKVDLLASGIGITNIELVNKIKNSLIDFTKTEIPVDNIYIVATVLKNIIDPRAIVYIPIDDIINGFAVAITWCIENNHNTMALILSSVSKHEMAHTLNMSTKTKLDQDIKNQLLEVYPYSRAIRSSEDETKHISYMEEYVNNLGIEYSKYNLFSLLPIDILEQISGSKDRTVVLPADIKNQLAMFFIDIESKTK